MGELVTLPDGRQYRLPAGISSEERASILLELRSLFGIAGDYVPNAGISGQPTNLSEEQAGLPEDEVAVAPQAPIQAPIQQPRQVPIEQPAAGITSLPPTSTPAPSPEVDDYAGRRTVLGGIGTLIKSMPIGLQQGWLLGKQALQGITSLDEDTQGEKDTRRKLDELILKVDPVYRDSNWAGLGMGLGTMGGFMIPGAVTAATAPLLGVGAAGATIAGTVASMTAGGVMNAGAMSGRTARYEEETGEDVSVGKELAAMTGGFAMGLTEAVPIAKYGKKAFTALGLRRGLAKTGPEIAEELLQKGAPVTVKSILEATGRITRSAGRQAVEEGAQEAIQGFGNSAIAKGLYDDDALVGVTGEMWREALMGGQIGAIADLTMQAVIGGMGVRKRRGNSLLRSAAGHIGDARREGLEQGTIDDNMLALLSMDDNGEFVDQSPEAIDLRDELRLTPESSEDGNPFGFASKMIAEATAVREEELARIKREFRKTEIPLKERQEIRATQIAQMEARFKLYRDYAVLAGGILAERETGVDPTKPSREEVDAAEAEKAEESKVEQLVAEEAPEPVAEAPLVPPTGMPVTSMPEYGESRGELPLETEDFEGELAENILQSEEDLEADLIRSLAEGWNVGAVDVGTVVDAVEEPGPLAEPRTFSVGDLGAIVYDWLTPSSSYLRDTEIERYQREETRTHDVLQKQQEELGRLTLAESLFTEEAKETSDATEQVRLDRIRHRAELALGIRSSKVGKVISMEDARKDWRTRNPDSWSLMDSKEAKAAKAFVTKEMRGAEKEISDLENLPARIEALRAELEVDNAARDALELELLEGDWSAVEDIGGEQAGLPEDLEALEEIIRSKNQSLEDLEGTNTGLLERLQTTYGGVTKKDRYLEYIRRQREVVSDNVGLLSQTDLDVGHVVDRLVGRDAAGNEFEIEGSRNLLTGFPADTDARASATEKLVDDNLEMLFGEGHEVNLEALVQRLPTQSQRNSLVALQREIDSNPDKGITPEAVRAHLSKIVDGGLIDETEMVQGWDISRRYEDAREETQEVRVDEDPAAIGRGEGAVSKEVTKELEDAERHLQEKREERNRAAEPDFDAAQEAVESANVRLERAQVAARVPIIHGRVSTVVKQIPAKEEESVIRKLTWRPKEFSEDVTGTASGRVKKIGAERRELGDTLGWVEPSPSQYSIANVEHIMRRILAKKTKNPIEVPAGATFDQVQDIWDANGGGKTEIFKNNNWDYDYLRDILPAGVGGEPLTDADIRSLVPAYSHAGDSRRQIISQGHDLVMALTGGPRRHTIGPTGKTVPVKRKTDTSKIHMLDARAASEIDADMELEISRVMSDLFDPGVMSELGVFLERNGTDRPAIKGDPDSHIPHTADSHLALIRRRIIENKSNPLPLSLIHDALISRGLAKVERGKLVVESGFVGKVIDSTLGTDSEGMSDADALARLNLSEQYIVLARIMKSTKNVVHTDAQPSVPVPLSVLSLSQRGEVLTRIRDAGNKGFNLDRRSKDMISLMESLGKDISEASGIRALIESYSAVVERIGTTNRYRFNAGQETKKVKIPTEQKRRGEARKEAVPVIAKGIEQESNGQDTDGNPVAKPESWPDSEQARADEAVNAQGRINALKAAARREAVKLFGRVKGNAIVIEIESAYDSIYAEYLKKLSNKNSKAYIDTYTGTMVFNISNLEGEYASEYANPWDVPVEVLARDATFHEGLHILFLKGVLGQKESRNLRLYGEAQRVPEAVSPDAVNPTDNSRMTWRQWIESQPSSSQLSADEKIEEMQVQILDALAKDLIPGAKSAGAINDIKQKLLNTAKVLIGVQEEGSLSSILSVFDVVQDQVEIARRLKVAEDSNLETLRFVERADPKDLADLVAAMKANDEVLVKEIAKKIAHQRVSGVAPVSTTQNFMNQMLAREELGETPKGIISMLNGDAVADGTISPGSLDEYFSIQKGNTPYAMTEPRRREMGRRRTTPITEAYQKIIDMAEEHSGVKIGDGDSLRNALNLLNVSGDRTPDDLKKSWEIAAENAVAAEKSWAAATGWKGMRARFRKGALDKRLAHVLASLEAQALRKSDEKLLAVMSEVDSITAWRYNDQAQSFLSGMVNHGPMEYYLGGFRIFRGEVDLPELRFIDTTGAEHISSASAIGTPEGLAVIFKPIEAEADTKVATEYGTAVRVLVARHELDQNRSEFVEAMVKAGFDRKKLEGILATKEGSRLGAMSNIKDSSSDLVRLKTLPKLTDEQAAIWRRFADPAKGSIGGWQRRYDTTLLPGEHIRTKKTQPKRYGEHLKFFLTVQADAAKNPGGSSAAVIEFWLKYRMFNSVNINQAYRAELIDKRRRDLYLRMGFMPFYRDTTGWEESSPLSLGSHSPEGIEAARRDIEEADQKVAPEREARKNLLGGKTEEVVGAPLLDRNIDGSWAPINSDLMGMLLQNSQALVRDIMWHTATNGTVDEQTVGDAPTMREQRFLTVDDIDANDKIKFEEAGVPWDPKAPMGALGGFKSEKQRKIMYEQRGLWTPEELTRYSFSDQTIRVKKKGEARYYRAMDILLVQSTMAVGVSPRQTMAHFFEDNVTMGNERLAQGLTKLLIGASTVLREAVTLSPVFWNVNVGRDSWQASVIHGGGPKLVLEAFKNFYLGELDLAFIGMPSITRKKVWQEDLYKGKGPGGSDRGGYRKVKKDPTTGKWEKGEGAYERAQRLGLNVAIDYMPESHQKSWKELILGTEPERTDRGKEIMQARDLEWDTPAQFVKNILWTGPLKGLRRAVGQSEIATRIAVHDRTMEDTHGNASQAFHQGIEIINYGRRGDNPMFGMWTAMSPFMNGRIAGLDVTWRTHAGYADAPGYHEGDNPVNVDEVLGEVVPVDADGRKFIRTRADVDKLMGTPLGGKVSREQFERVRRTAARGLLLASITGAYVLWRYDDEDYQNARDDERSNYWLMPWGLRIPIPFEVGTFYKVVPEQLLLWILDSTHDAGDVSAEAKRQITGSLGLWGAPQLFRPSLDAASNRDRFQKDDIVPGWMAGDLLATEQLRTNTSYVARGLSESMSRIPLVNQLDFLTSPMKLEYLLRQQFGTLGAYTTNLADAIWAWSNDINRAGTSYNFGISSLWAPQILGGTGDSIGEEWNRVPILGDLFYDPVLGGGYQEDFFRWIEYLDQLVLTMGQIEESDPERHTEMERDNEVLLGHKETLRDWETMTADYRDTVDFIKRRTDISRETKTRMIQSLTEGRDEELRGIRNIISDIKSNRTPADILKAIGLSFRKSLREPTR